MKKKTERTINALLIFSIGIVLFLLGLVGTFHRKDTPKCTRDANVPMITEPNLPVVIEPNLPIVIDIIEVNPVDVMESVVHIAVETEYGGWQGSGVYIGGGLILTAGHVVDGATNFILTFEDGCVYESEEFYKEDVSDVGFILLDTGDSVCHTSIPFDNRTLARGEDVWILGSPYGTEFLFTVSKGIVSNTTLTCDGFFGEKPIFMVDAASYPGNSGGPVVDEDGEIIGILVGGYGSYDNLSICIRVDVIVLSLEKYKAQLKLENL